MARSIASVLPAIASLFLVSCQEDEPLKSVDLRFFAEDAYSLTASAAEPIKIKVSSTDAWEVYSKNPAWCFITPSAGDASAVDNLAETTEVTIQYEDNTGLDDRIDTIIIQSDYWIGKWIQVTQKGTAYLDFENPEEMPQDGGNDVVAISTNHIWRAEVTVGSTWLSLNGTVSGEGDGKVSFTAEPNKGEVRTGIITIYDHNDVSCGEISVSQAGVQLDPAVTLVKTDWKAKEYIIKVESNAKWTVEKDDDDVSWYSFPETEFEGSQELKITINESPATAVRTARFTISSVSDDESVTPVAKRIVLKQSYQFKPEILEFDQAEIDATWMVWGYGYEARGDDLIMTSGARTEARYRELGYHTYKVKEMDDDAVVRFELCYNGTMYSIMLRWGGDATTGKTFSQQGDKSDLIAPVPFDHTRPNEFSYYVAPNEDNYIYVEYMLNGDVVGTYVFDGSDGGQVITYPLEGHLTILVGATSGAAEDAVVLDSWGHCPVIDWGD